MMEGNTLKKKVLTQKILLGLLSASFIGGSMFVPHTSYAATKVVSAQTVQTEEGAGDFSNRIQKILEEYHKENAAQGSKWAHHEISATSSSKDSQSVLNEAAQPDYYGSAEVVQDEDAQQYAQSNAAADAYEPRYNFDWQGTPLANSIYGIAKMANKDIVINGALEGTVYMSLHNVTYLEALQRLSNAFNLNWMIQGNSVVVSTADLMKQSKTFHIHHIFNMDSLKSELKGIGIEEDSIYPNSEQRTVSVTGTAYQLQQVERRLKEIDRPISQCLVVAQLIEVSHGKNLDLGFSYTLPSYTHTGNTTSGSSSMTTTSSSDSSDGSDSGATTSSGGSGATDDLHGNWLAKLTFGVTSTANRALNNGKVIARPMIMMMNGQEGKVNFGDQVPIMTTTATTGATTVDTEYKDVGTQLTITPTIDEETGTVTMKVDTQVSNITGYQTMGANKAPQISTRQATTSAHLKTGESFVIGGLMTKQDLQSLNGIPGLMNLPILGELFKFRSTSHKYGEVYIMLTPYIVTDDVDPQKLIRNTYGDKIQSEIEAENAKKEAK